MLAVESTDKRYLFYIIRHELISQCVFDKSNLELPCKRCEMKDWPCSTGDKTMTSKAKPTQTRTIASRNAIPTFSIAKPVPNNNRDIIPGFDPLYLGHYIFHWIDKSSFFSALTPNIWISTPYIFLYRCHGNISATTFRAAALVLSSYVKDSNNLYNVWKYYEAFCASARKATQDGDLIDLLHGSYLIAIYHIASWESDYSVAVHFLQFCRAAHALATSTPISIDLAEWIMHAWVFLFLRLYYWRSSCLPRGYLLEALKASSYILSCIETRKIFPRRMLFNMRIQLFQVHLRYYLECASSQDESLDELRFYAKTQVIEILDAIRELPKVADLLHQIYDIEYYLQTTYHGPIDPNGCLQFPSLCRSFAVDINSLHAAFLFCSAQLLMNILELDFIVDDYTDRRLQVNYSAIALCRLVHCAHQHDVTAGGSFIRDLKSWERSGLFLACLAFKRDSYSTGNSPFKFLLTG